MARRGSLTLQDSIDEENRIALSDPDQKISTNPSTNIGLNPLSPESSYARNTLGVDSSTPRHGSIAGIGVGVTSPNQPRKKRLDPSDPSTWTTTASSTDIRPRAASETQRIAGLPLIQFDGPSETNKDRTNTASATPMQSSTLQDAKLGLTEAALNTEKNALPIRTGQPETETLVPSTSSGSALLSSAATLHLAPSPASLTVGRDGDADRRRFSNQSASFSTVTDDSDRIGAISGEGDADDEEVVHDSSDDEHFSDEQDEGSPVTERGRKRKPSDETSSPESGKNAVRVDPTASPKITVSDTSVSKQEHPRPPGQSGSLSETQSSVTPRSNYRAASPAALSALGDDDAELRRAKALQLRVSPLDERIKERTVKMVIRGEWGAFQDHEDEEQGFRHEPRLYLVCSDLSNEASYALEWTVGTLLKDGDTLLVVSAVEDENAHKYKDNEEPSLEVRLESAKAAEEANSTMDTLTRQTTNVESTNERDERSRMGIPKGLPRSSSRSGRTRKDDERIKAVDKIENDFLRYVRKTVLQVRCMIEVIHCRSPRHLVLNAIDELEPTLVVVGTRGQSTVKSVMLGSFSNYLVTKSSIPVMVARKRLKKAHHAKVSSQQIRMTNNLTPFGLTGKRKSLTQARID